MSTLPGWLTVLQRVREHRRDVARQSLVRSLRAVDETRKASASVTQALARLQEDQREAGQAGALDAERLRQLRSDRELQCSRLADARRLRAETEHVLQSDQRAAADCDAAAEILQRLSDRVVSAARIEQQRRQILSTWEASLSLSNGRMGD